MISDSNRWKIAIRIIMVLLGIIQAGMIGWVKYMTNEVIQQKAQMMEAKSDMRYMREDISYIRTKLDSLFELRRR